MSDRTKTREEDFNYGALLLCGLLAGAVLLMVDRAGVHLSEANGRRRHHSSDLGSPFTSGC